MDIRRLIRDFFARNIVAWEIFMIVLAIIFVVISFLPDFLRFSETGHSALNITDWSITAIFVLEFVVRFWAATSRTAYLKGHWIDIIAIIPMVRWLRLARLAVVIRLLRLTRLVRVLNSLDTIGFDIAMFARMNGLQWMLLTLASTMLLMSVLFFFFERPVNPEITSYWSALYASLETWTTPGYGDIAPVTIPGRFVGLFLIISGVVTWGVLIGNLSAFLMSMSARKVARNGADPVVDELKKKLSRIDCLSRGELIALRGAVNAVIDSRMEGAK